MPPTNPLVSPRYPRATPRRSTRTIRSNCPSTVAHWDGDVLTVHDSTRWITGERTALAAYLGLPEENVRILSPLVGGAFGSKSFLWMHVALCAVAAREVAAPGQAGADQGPDVLLHRATGRAPSST